MPQTIATTTKDKNNQNKDNNYNQNNNKNNNILMESCTNLDLYLQIP